MTVRELIDLLEQHRDDADVFVNGIALKRKQDTKCGISMDGKDIGRVWLETEEQP